MNPCEDKRKNVFLLIYIHNVQVEIIWQYQKQKQN